MDITVISLGGSIIAPDKVDSTFLKEFKKAITEYLDRNKASKLILVCGGGAPARIYQSAFKEIMGKDTSVLLQDWLGIRATHLNGTLLRFIFKEYTEDELVIDPTKDILFSGRILVAAGWKPGFSTDTDAVYLAKKFGGKKIINLSNIAQVYTDDPKINKNAKPIEKINWKEFRRIVGSEWVPGKNTPFDPVASALAEEDNIEVICADGRNIENLIAILEGREYFGTTISN